MLREAVAMLVEVVCANMAGVEWTVMWQCALQSVSQEMDSVWLPTIVAVIQDGQAVSVKHAYQLMDVVSQFVSISIVEHITLSNRGKNKYQWQRVASKQVRHRYYIYGLGVFLSLYPVHWSLVDRIG